MHAHPETIHDLYTAETWFLAHDLVDFRRRLILGDPEADWSAAEAEGANLDCYRRFDPVKGWVWAIYRFDDGTHYRVGTTDVMPDRWLLRNLAKNSLRNGYDFLKSSRARKAARVREASAAMAEAQDEIREMVRSAEAGKRVW